MYSHIFLYRLRCLLRDKDMLFWTVVFPVILLSLMHATIMAIPQDGGLPAIRVALVDSDELRAETAFLQVVDTIASKGSWLSYELVGAQEAERLLREGGVIGIIEGGRPLRWRTASPGLRQSLVKAFLDQYVQGSSALGALVAERPEAWAALGSGFEPARDRLLRDESDRRKGSVFLVTYFALIAMACFYGGYFGLYEAIEIQASLSARAARLNLSPCHKLKVFLSNTVASLCVHYAGLLLLLAFLRFVIKVDFGRRYPELLVLCLVGSLLAIVLGCLVSLLLKAPENAKNAVVTGISMVGSILAGLMVPGVKHLVESKAPLARWLNPVGLLADGCYALYFDESGSRFVITVAVLAAYALAIGALVYAILRRRTYDSL